MTTVTETFRSREGDLSNTERRYLVADAASPEAARAAVLLTAPATDGNGLALDARGIRIEPINLTDYLAVAPYSDRNRGQPLATGEMSLTIDTGGATLHRDQTLSRLSSTPATGYDAAPDFGGAINVTGSGVQGVDVPGRAFKLTVRRRMADADFDSDYLAALYGCTGKTNDDSYSMTVNSRTLSFDAHCLALASASATQPKAGADWDVTLEFEAIPATDDAFPGITDSPVAKAGWDYAWAYYVEEEDTGASRLIMRPAAVYVDQVLEEADFSDLLT